MYIQLKYNNFVFEKNKINHSQMKNTLLLILIAIFSSYFISSSCKKKENKNKDTVAIDSDSILIQQKIQQAKEIFYSLPAPQEVAELLTNQQNDTYFDQSLLNDLDNSNKYTTEIAQAYNLGIYSADLSYASLYEQNQIVIKYMATNKTLAGDLGIINAFDKETIDKLQDNVNNRDQIMRIISENFMNSDAYLQESNRQDIGAMILLGGWIEGMYIATKLSDFKTSKNKKLVSSILEQKLSLELTVKFLENYKNYDGLRLFYDDINGLYKIYESIPTEIDNQGLLTAKENDYLKICEKIKKIRNKMISLT